MQKADAEPAHAWIREHRREREPWQRDDGTLANLDGLVGLGADAGAALVRVSGGRVSLIQFAGGDGSLHELIASGGRSALELPALDSDGPTLARTAPNVVLGTLGDMSPEQVTGNPVDGRLDIFALGCILYEMLRGRALFAGSTPQEIVAQLMLNRVPELSGFEAVVPRELQPIVSRCIERAPSRRFDSASDLAMALRGLLSGSTVVGSARRPRSRGKSLGVLPFVNAGADPAIEYLIDGITESIINSVSQLSGLRVVPRSLVFRYKGLQADPSTIGVALNARTILTGRVSQQGEYLTIQAELVDTATESQLWGEQFRLQLHELPNVQQDIAWQISEALRLKLTGAQKKKLRKRATVNAEVYEEYLRGRYFFNAWSPDGFRLALRHFERAIEHDPTYAPAYAGLGDTIGSMSGRRTDPGAGRIPARAGGRRESNGARSRAWRRVRNAGARQPVPSAELAGLRAAVQEVDRVEPEARQRARVLRDSPRHPGTSRPVDR